MKKISLWEIYKIFFIIGIQLLGGGYVILPLLRKYIVEERNWLSEEELVDYFALSQCTPGIIAGNISMFSGYKARGIFGALTAILGIITPSFFAIILLANILNGAIENKIVQDAFWGIRISVIVLVIVTVKDMWAKSVYSRFTSIIFIVVLIALLFFPISPAIVILLSAIAAVLHSKVIGGKNA